MIPFVNLVEQRNRYRQEFEKIEKEVLDSGCFIGGPHVKGLENDLSGYIETHSNLVKNGLFDVPKVHTIACGSGTDALTIALMALGIQPGDQVIVPNFTFIAPAECVFLQGATPKFADIDRKNLQISPDSVKKLINSKTKGIIAVNLFGQCAPYGELRQIAKENGLWIIEDSAQSFGATQNGQQACTFGDISITSFYPAKPLGCYGDGGALFTASEEQANKIRMIANHGSPGHYDHQISGVNSRLDAIQAAILQVKLKHLDEELKVRETNAIKYNQFFENYGDMFNPQAIAEGNTSTYAQYTLRVKDRDRFTDKLTKAEIPFCIHYPATLDRQPAFASIKGLQEPTPNATEASQQAVSLPICAFTNVGSIIEKLKNVL